MVAWWFEPKECLFVHTHTPVFGCFTLCVWKYPKRYSRIDTFICMYVCTCAHGHVHADKHSHTHPYPHIHTHTHTHTRPHTHIRPHTPIHTHSHNATNTYTHTYAFISTYTYTYTHVHVHIHSNYGIPVQTSSIWAAESRPRLQRQALCGWPCAVWPGPNLAAHGLLVSCLSECMRVSRAQKLCDGLVYLMISRVSIMYVCWSLDACLQ